MNLRVKVFLYVGGTLLTLFFIVYHLFNTILVSGFDTLEKSLAEEGVRRVSGALESEMNNLEVKISDWAQWDDTYSFIENKNEEYLKVNLQDSALALLRLNFVVLTDASGSILFKKQINAEGKEVSFPEGFEEYIVDHSKFYEQENSQNVRSGLIVLPEGLVMMVTQAVTTSDGLSPAKGTILFGFFVDDEMVIKLANLTHLKLMLKRFDDIESESQFALAAQNLEDKDSIFVRPTDPKDSVIYGYGLETDIDGKKALISRVELDRSLYRHGQGSVALFSKIMIGISLSIIAAVFLLFEYLVLRRIFSLERAVEEISQSQDSGASIVLAGNDEFSSLAERINTMLRSLRDAEAKRKESEKRFQTVADSAPVMIWMSDLDKKNTYVNKVWLDYTGRSLEHELGTGWKSDIHPDDLKMSDSMYEAAFALQKPFNVEYRLRRKDGSYGWVFSRAIPHFSVDGVFLGYIGSCVDITERKEVEEQRRGYIEEIESLNRIMVEREIKMIELKKKIKQMESGNIR